MVCMPSWQFCVGKFHKMVYTRSAPCRRQHRRGFPPSRQRKKLITTLPPTPLSQPPPPPQSPNTNPPTNPPTTTPQHPTTPTLPAAPVGTAPTPVGPVPVPAAVPVAFATGPGFLTTNQLPATTPVNPANPASPNTLPTSNPLPTLALSLNTSNPAAPTPDVSTNNCTYRCANGTRAGGFGPKYGTIGAVAGVVPFSRRKTLISAPVAGVRMRVGVVAGRRLVCSQWRRVEVCGGVAVGMSRSIMRMA